MTMPPPTPISPETWMKSTSSSWPPNHSSPRAARLASLSATTGSSWVANRSARISATGTSTQSRFGASRSSPRSVSTGPGTATPSPATVSRAASADSMAVRVIRTARPSTLAGDWPRLSRGRVLR